MRWFLVFGTTATAVGQNCRMVCITHFCRCNYVDWDAKKKIQHTYLPASLCWQKLEMVLLARKLWKLSLSCLDMKFNKAGRKKSCWHMLVITLNSLVTWNVNVAIVEEACKCQPGSENYCFCTEIWQIICHWRYSLSRVKMFSKNNSEEPPVKVSWK